MDCQKKERVAIESKRRCDKYPGKALYRTNQSLIGLKEGNMVKSGESKGDHSKVKGGT